MVAGLRSSGQAVERMAHILHACAHYIVYVVCMCTLESQEANQQGAFTCTHVLVHNIVYCHL